MGLKFLFFPLTGNKNRRRPLKTVPPVGLPLRGPEETGGDEWEKDAPPSSP